MDEFFEDFSSLEDNYKSYENELDEYNPDDYESDYWEDMLPDVDEMAEEFERLMEEGNYAYGGNDYYSRNLSEEELDRRLDEEFYGRR